MQEKSHGADAKAEAESIRDINVALHYLEELNKKIKQLDRKIETNSNNDNVHVDVGIGGDQAQEFLSKQAKEKSNKTPQERREQDALLNDLDEQNQEMLAQQSRLLESRKIIFVEHFMANHWLNLSKARELIKCVLMTSSVDVA